MYTTQHYNSLTLLYLNSQLISKFQTNSIFTLKKKTLTDKHNYSPLKSVLSITFVKKKKKKIYYSYKHKKTKKRRRQNSTHRAQHVGGMEDIDPPLDSRHIYYFL